MKALDLAGADLPLEGQLVVAAPGQIPAATRLHASGGDDASRDLGDGADRGWTDAARSRRTSSRQRSAGSAALRTSRSACRRPTSRSERPAARRSARRSTAPSSRSTASSAAVATGAWISSWVPYKPGVGTPNAAGVVVAPAAVAPGALSIAAKISGRGAIVSGTRHAGRSATRRCDRHGLRRNREGEAHDAQASPCRSEREVHDEVRSRDVLPRRRGRNRRAAPAVCTQLQPLIGAMPCVNPTVNGFTAKSKVVRKKK